MSLDNLDEQLRQARTLSLEIPKTTQSEPSSAASSEPASPNPLAESDTLVSASMTTSSETHTRASSTTTASTSSLPMLRPSSSTTGTAPASPSIKFAPLPELAPRKRRSKAPLGMAARGQLARRRRGMSADDQDQDPEQGLVGMQGTMLPAYVVPNPMWTDEELEQTRLRHEAVAARHAQYQATATALAVRHHVQAEAATKAREAETGERRRRGAGSSRDDLDDPPVSLGKIVKGARKILWKRGSNKDVVAAVAAEAGKEENKGKGKEEGGKRRKLDAGSRKGSLSSSTLSSSMSSSSVPVIPLRPILVSINQEPETKSKKPEEEEKEEEKEEEGRVWEEEIDEAFLNVGQTETVVDGRVVYSSKVEVSVSSRVEMTSVHPSLPSPPSPSPPPDPKHKTKLVKSPNSKSPPASVKGKSMASGKP